MKPAGDIPAGFFFSALSSKPLAQTAEDITCAGRIRADLSRDSGNRRVRERAVQINPSNATAWVHLGLAYELLNNPAAALDAYRRALAITPKRAEAIELYEAARRRYGR